MEDSENHTSERHGPLDWNGWGIGVEDDLVEAQLSHGGPIEAWRSEVQAVLDATCSPSIMLTGNPRHAVPLVQAHPAQDKTQSHPNRAYR